MAVFERSTASLHHYLGCPAVPFELYVVEKAGAVRGYFLLTFVQRQARLAESWVDSTDAADWRVLHLLAVHQSRQHPEAVELATMCSDAITQQSLVDCGFHHRGSSELNLFDCGKHGLPDVELRAQMTEGDAAYLHDGQDNLLA